MQVILETQRSGLNVLGGFVFAAVVRGGWRAVKQGRINRRERAEMLAKAAYDREYAARLLAYHRAQGASGERSTGE
jgi:hypothetical protein